MKYIVGFNVCGMVFEKECGNVTEAYEAVKGCIARNAGTDEDLKDAFLFLADTVRGGKTGRICSLYEVKAIKEEQENA